MRLRGQRPRKFQMGGGAGGTSFVPMQSPNLPQQLAAARFGAGAAPGAAPGAAGAAPGAAAQANPVMQQLAGRGVVPTPAPTAGPASTLGAMAPAAPGGMIPPTAGGVPGNFQPRPGMGWGAAPGAGPMGVPAGGATGFAGAGGAPGAVPPGMQQQAVLGALAGRGTAAPGAGMPGAAPPAAGMPGGGINPQVAAALAAQQAQSGIGGFAKGGKVVARKGTTGPIQRQAENSFDSTKPVPGNLPIRPGKGKEPLAKAKGGGIGGRILSHSETAGDAPDRPVQRSANRISPNVGTTGPIKRGPVNSFDSTCSVGDNLPIRPGKGKEALAKARGGVVRRRPAATSAAVTAGARRREDRRSPSPQPYYDTPAAGDDGWPPTPSFSGAPGANAPAPGMKKGGKWIQSAIKHPGSLRKALHVPEGENIPRKTLARAAEKSGKIGEKARMAETLNKLRKRKGGACVEDKDKDAMRKGGECEKMAAGGAAKERRGFPNTIPHPGRLKRMATGGSVRGTGIAERGTRFSGIY